MTKILFLPLRLIGGFLAGKVAERAFDGIWSLVDKQESPKPDQWQVRWPKLLAALTLEGAIFRLVRGAFDHGSRLAFKRLTGSWPGEQAPTKA